MRSDLAPLVVAVAPRSRNAGVAPAGAGDLLLSVSPGGPGAPRAPDPFLRTVDSADGSTVAGASVAITLAGRGRNRSDRPRETTPRPELSSRCLRLEGTSFRHLVTLDEWTGVATSVGDTGNRFAGIAFASDGTLYAVTGDGGGVPESLFILSTVNGSPSLVRELGAGSDGETLAFNPDDGFLYHASGIGTPNHPNGEQFETIDLDTLADHERAAVGLRLRRTHCAGLLGRGLLRGRSG